MAYANKIVLGNGKTMTRPAGTTDAEWTKLVQGYISRFGALQSGGTTTTATTAQPTQTVQPTQVAQQTQTATPPKTYEQLKAMGYTDFKIQSMGVSVPKTATTTATTAQPTQTVQPTQVAQQTQTAQATQQPAQNQAANEAALKILNNYLNQGVIDSGTYQMFKQAIELWNPNNAVDFANILNTFEQLKQSDIDPYFKEQANIFIDDLQRNREYLQASRAIETEQQEKGLDQAKEAMQTDLAKRGLLFSGEAIKKLGIESPFALEGSPEAQKAAIPTMQRFGGEAYEGELQKMGRVASDTSQLRYEKQLQDLQRQAEQYLGSDRVGGLIPGVQAMGGVTGSLTSQQKQAYGSTLSSLYGQQQQNLAAQEQIKVFN
jgi:hypothetical protein